jgi:hypothetical protein
MNDDKLEDLLAKSKNKPNITFNTDIFNLFIKDIEGINDVIVKGLTLDSQVKEIKIQIAQNLIQSGGYQNLKEEEIVSRLQLTNIKTKKPVNTNSFL